MTDATTQTPVTLLRRVRLELAREPGHPDGSRNIGYEFIAPVSDDGHILEDIFHKLKDRCRVRRFDEGEPDEIGHVVRKRGGAWAFHYDIHGDPTHDDTGFKLNSHRFVPGEYVSIREPEGQLKTYRVISVLELD
ncbi:MAG: hypothetical protein ACM3L9_05250 [Deltaproteobacteria bacterium]